MDQIYTVTRCPALALLQLCPMVIYDQFLKPKIPIKVSYEEPDPAAQQDILLDRWPMAKLMAKENCLKKSVS